jgi:hypothetical protein
MILRPSADGDVSFRRALLLLLLLLLMVVVVAFSAGTWRRPDEAGRRRERCLLKVPLPYVSPTARHGAAAGADTVQEGAQQQLVPAAAAKPSRDRARPTTSPGERPAVPERPAAVPLHCRPNVFRRTRSGPLAVRTSAGNVHQRHHLAHGHSNRGGMKGESVRVYMSRSWALDGVVNCRGSTPALVRPGGFGWVPQKKQPPPTATAVSSCQKRSSSPQNPPNKLLALHSFRGGLTMTTRREASTEAPPPRCFAVAKPGRDWEHLVRCFPRYGASWGEGCTRDRVAQDLEFMSDSTSHPRDGPGTQSAVRVRQLLAPPRRASGSRSEAPPQPALLAATQLPGPAEGVQS